VSYGSEWANSGRVQVTMTTPSPPSETHNPIAEALFALVEEQREFRVETQVELKQAVDTLNRSVGAMNGLMKDLHVALTGDELGNPGLIHRQNDLQGQIDEMEMRRRESIKRVHDKVDVLEQKFNRIFWVGTGIGIGSGVGTSGIIALILRATGNGG